MESGRYCLLDCTQVRHCTLAQRYKPGQRQAMDARACVPCRVASPASLCRVLPCSLSAACAALRRMARVALAARTAPEFIRGLPLARLPARTIRNHTPATPLPPLPSTSLPRRRRCRRSLPRVVDDGLDALGIDSCAVFQGDVHDPVPSLVPGPSIGCARLPTKQKPLFHSSRDEGDSIADVG